ncbi:MAG: hypothetical protein V1711_01030 [bacterium]
MDIQPKKYIRTFAGDMETVKKGGTPDLAPLVESKPIPAERLVAASPIPPPIQPPIPAPILTPKPEPSPIPEPQKPTPIKTYESDFSDQIEKEHASAATVLAAEQDAATGEIQQTQPMRSSHNSVIYTVIGVVFLIAGGAAVYFTYTKSLTAVTQVVFTPSVSAPIFVDDREQVSGVGPTLLEAIEKSIGRPLTAGAIRLLYTFTETDSTNSPQIVNNSIFSDLQEPAPDVLLRNLNAEGSMAGVININNDQSPFFILSVISYSNTFSGMLKWESTMQRDLVGLFPSTASTTLPSSVKISAGFRDEIVNNHDVRVYRDENNESVLLYGYWDQSTLIIARNPAAFAEILNRLANSRTQHGII